MDDRLDRNARIDSERLALDRHVRTYHTGTWPLPPEPWFTQELLQSPHPQRPPTPFTFHHTHRYVRRTTSVRYLRRHFDLLWWHRINFLPVVLVFREFLLTFGTLDKLTPSMFVTY